MPESRDDEQCLKLGREIVRMIRDLRTISGEDAGYAKRTVTFPGGRVTIFVANTEELADVLDRAAAESKKYAIENAIAPSTLN